MSEKYTSEKDGQIDFYNQFLPRINPHITVDEIIANNNDGVLNGNLIEFKLSVKDLNEVLFQCVKYLSSLRIKGTPVPANIVIIDLNAAKAYFYKSENYLESIEKIYNGGASKNNSGFIRLYFCIVSTVEYYEYKVLQELIGSKVKAIIPLTETKETFNAGLVSGADALSKEYVENEVIKQYIDNQNYTIILFENPPYAETTSIEHQRIKQSKESSSWKNSFVVKEIKKEVKGAVSNDLGNAFIWSAFKYYLRQNTDGLAVFRKFLQYSRLRTLLPILIV